MTEQTTNAPVTDENVTDTPPPVEEQPWYDDVFGVLFSKVVILTDAVNAEVDWLKAHSSDLLTVIESIETGNSDTAVKAQAKIEGLKNEILEIETALRTWATAQAKDIISQRDDKDAIAEHEAAHAKARTAYRDYVKVFKSNYETADLGPYLPEVKNLTRKGSGSGKSGGSRMRGFTLWTVDGSKVGGTVDGEFKSTASDAAKAAGIDLSELQNEYKRLHGDDSKQWPPVANFEFKDHKFSAHREDKEAAKPSEPSADVSPSSQETTNGTATS